MTIGVARIFPGGGHFFKNVQKIFKNFSKIIKKYSKNNQNIFKKFSKILKNFLKKMAKNALFKHIFQNFLAIHALNFCAFGPKTQFVGDF